ncbi:DUF3631 domain-containing protein [Mycobacterium simiae]|uniref:DUF3631 domain-containing protein n=1 Tax=Mycobacterium simiae TaxID=1784 RepID=A0A1X0XIC3_MYCSI|nr:DUF3631 domain-containing protein [Mycobacterium simiae]ORJ52597.1 hypothetical protein B5M45_30895 [Mycobacterium simiae]
MQQSEVSAGDQDPPSVVAAELVDLDVDSAVEDPDRWDGPPVDGAELLAEIEQFAGRYLALPTQHHLVVLSLWIAHTWAVKAFYTTPRLVLSSPEPGSGKTRVLEVLGLLCCNAKITVSASPAALFRRISLDETPPTILQDECDTVFGRSGNSQAEDLRAIYNSGYKAGATVDRCERDSGEISVAEFPVFAPVALAGLIFGAVTKHMRTVLDRAVVFHMLQRAPDEHLDEFRGRDAEATAAPMRKCLRAWAADHFDALEASRPGMPEGVRDRRAEVWEALLAIADEARGGWPERAREACLHFEHDAEPDDEQLSRGVRLLRAVRQAFGIRDRMHSADLVAALTSDLGSEWADLFGTKLDQRSLAKELKRYGVQSIDVRIEGSIRKGYVVSGAAGLGRAWARWLPSPDMGNKRDKGDTAGLGVADGAAQEDQRNGNATADRPLDQDSSGGVADVAEMCGIGVDAAGNSDQPRADSGASIDDRFARLQDKLVGDAAVHRPKDGGSGHDSDAEGLCLSCGSRLGPSTRRCTPCILKRVRGK